MHSILFLASPKVLVSFNFKKWVYSIHVCIVGRSFRRGFPNGEVALEVQACPVGIPIIFLCILIFFVVWETYKKFVVVEMFVNVTWYVQVATTISIWIRGCLLFHLAMVPRRMRDAFSFTLTHTMCKMEGVLVLIHLSKD